MTEQLDPANDTDHLWSQLQNLPFGVDGDDDTRLALVSKLHAQPANVIVPLVLASPLASNDEKILACDVLSQLNYVNSPDLKEQAHAFLARALATVDEKLLEAAIYATLHIGTTPHSDRLIELAGHESAIMRQAVATALGNDRSQEGAVALVHLLRDVDSDVRNWAAFGFTQRDDGTDEIRSGLLALLSDTTGEIRHEAILALAQRHDARSVAAIEQELRSGIVSVPLMEAIEEIPRPEWLPLLQEIRENEKRTWRQLERAIAACSRSRKQ